MFKYNKKTEINMQFKMQQLLKTIKADKIVKADAKNITKVTLTNILSPERTNMEASENVKEIYVFKIDLISNNVPHKIIDALNKNINFQTLVYLNFNNKVKYVVSIKEFFEQKPKILKTFESDWQDECYAEMPNVLSLENLFKQIIAKVTLISFKQNEGYKSYIERVLQITTLRKAIEKTTKAMNAEKQPNIKMKLNDDIREMKKSLQELEVYVDESSKNHT